MSRNQLRQKSEFNPDLYYLFQAMAEWINWEVFSWMADPFQTWSVKGLWNWLIMESGLAIFPGNSECPMVVCPKSCLDSTKRDPFDPGSSEVLNPKWPRRMWSNPLPIIKKKIQPCLLGRFEIDFLKTIFVTKKQSLPFLVSTGKYGNEY